MSVARSLVESMGIRASFLIVTCVVGVSACKPTTTELSLTDPLVIELTAHEHQWQIAYTGSSHRSPEVVIQSLGDIHIPEQLAVNFVLKSSDYIYTVSLPELGLKEIAVPNLEFTLQVGPTARGSYLFTGEQMCNEPNTRPPIHLIVEERQRFQAWIQQLQ